jgi:hypothetical protein
MVSRSDSLLNLPVAVVDSWLLMDGGTDGWRPTGGVGTVATGAGKLTLA